MHVSDTPRLSRRRSLGLLGAAAAAPALALVSPGPAAAQTPPGITALVTPTTDATPFYYAIHAGLFPRAGLDLSWKPIASGNLTIEGVVAGAGQIALANTLSLAQAHARGIPVELLYGAGFHSPQAPIVWMYVRADSPITRADQLVGSVLGISGLHDLLALAARAWLAQQHVDSTKVQFIELPQSQMLTALQRKRVDAIVTFEPFRSAVVASGTARAIATPYDAIARSFNVTCWFSYGPWLDAGGRAAAARFVSVMHDASVYANAHLPEMVPIVAAATGIAPENVSHALSVKTALAINPAGVQPVIDAAAKYGELAAAFPAREMLPSPPL